jgi:MerR family copper efflux transcriptional regulator
MQNAVSNPSCKLIKRAAMNIGQAAQASGVHAKMIRYYEEIDLLSNIKRTPSGYRQYSDRDVQMLRFIKRSRDLGFSLDRIRQLLALWQDTHRKSSDVKALAEQYMQELDDDIAKLQSIREQIALLSNCCHGDNRPDCPILDKLAETTYSLTKNQHI